MMCGLVQTISRRRVSSDLRKLAEFVSQILGQGRVVSLSDTSSIPTSSPCAACRQEPPPGTFMSGCCSGGLLLDSEAASSNAQLGRHDSNAF